MNYEKLRLTPRRFDIIFGTALLFGSPFLIKGEDLAAHPLFTGVCGVLIYFLEAWAFLYKVTAIRLRTIQNSTDGYWQVKGVIGDLPAIIAVGRFLRGFARVIILLISLQALRDALTPDSEVLSKSGRTVMILSIAFEVWIYKRARLRNKETGDAWKKSEYESVERVWRYAHENFFKSSTAVWKEIASEYILLVTAIMFTQSYWQQVWETYVYITDKAYENNLSPVLLMITMTFGLVISGITVVLPARLAFWIEEKWNEDPDKTIWQRRWSVFFAVAMTVLPVYIYVIRTYLQ